MHLSIPLLLTFCGVAFQVQGSDESPITTKVNVKDGTRGKQTSTSSTIDSIADNKTSSRHRRSSGYKNGFYVYQFRDRNGTFSCYYPVMRLREYDDFSGLVPYLDPDQKLYILFHGWLGSAAISASFSSSSVGDQELVKIKDEILKAENVTVILVDWSDDASSFDYYEAISESARVASRLAALVKDMVDAGVVRLSKVHFIGHSVGAHAGGYFAERLKLITDGGKIGRITGLDPAKPGFDNPADRLDPTDADFVDVIHTSNGVIALGYEGPLGHVDFYPNDGDMQPGCFFQVGCSHTRAKLYYANSVSRCTYPAKYCPSYEYFERNWCYCESDAHCGEMGHNASTLLRGVHYVKIRSSEPYCGSYV